MSTLGSPKKKENYEMESSLSLFKKEMQLYPVLTQDENAELCLKANFGNKEALNKLVKHNLRLIFKVSSRYFERLNHLKPMDVIQEASLALIAAARSYDPEKGAFSTHATNYMDGYIKRAIYNNEDEIRKPAHIKGYEAQYSALLAKFSKENNRMPTDEEICEKLKITDEVLEYLKNRIDYIPVSINRKMDDQDDESTELSDFIKYSRNDYNEVSKGIDNRNLLIFLKNILKPLDYYVIYYRYLTDNQKTLEAIGKNLNLTRESVRQIENKVLIKIKPYFEGNKSKYKNIILSLMESEKIDYININPISPENIIMYLYVRDYLSETEQKLLKLDLFGELKIEFYLKNNLALKDSYRNMLIAIKDKIDICLKNREKYNSFYKNIVRNYGNRIFDINLDEQLDYVNFDRIEHVYNKCSFDEILEIISSCGVSIDDNEFNLLKRYFEIPKYNNLMGEHLEKEIYLLSFDLKNKNVEIDKRKLYTAYKRNIDEFDEEQRLYVESYIFNKISRKIFLDKYPNSPVLKQRTLLMEKIERIYFNIYEYMYGSFNKKKYLDVKKKYRRLLTPDRIKILDMYYGIKGRVYTIQEIANIEGIDYIKMHDKLRGARDFCKSLYYNREGVLKNDLSKYVPYILDNSIDLSHRDLLHMFVIKKYDYTKISEITGMAKYQISNIITEGIRRLDFIRFGISESKQISKDELDLFFKDKSSLYNDEERIIIYLKYCEYKNNDEISRLCNKDSNEINKIISRFNKLYRSYIASKIDLNANEISKEINAHISESVINEEQKKLLSLYFGFKNKYNSEGKLLTRNEIMKELNITRNVYHQQFQFAMEYMKNKKVGLYRNDLVFIERQKLDELLEDNHLPISDKERDIICYLFELKGYPYKTLGELTVVFDDSESSLRRRYQRAILSIYKYINNEIEGKIDYEYDILPILKYFSKSDILLIEEYFHNNLTYEKISKKYKFTLDFVIGNITRIRDNIYDLVNDINAKKFDFEYYREHKEDDNLPFYGNREIASYAFEMFFGENDIKRYSVSEIIEKLNKEYAVSSINRLIIDYMLSFCKLKEGIIKVKEISNDEVYSFYIEHESELTDTEKIAFNRYFKFHKGERILNSKRSKINNTIIYVILKNNNPNFFSIENTTREEVISIIKKYKKQMIPSVRKSLMNKFEITEREFMNGKDKNHVFKILNRIEKIERLKENELVLKRTLD